MQALILLFGAVALTLLVEVGALVLFYKGIRWLTDRPPARSFGRWRGFSRIERTWDWLQRSREEGGVLFMGFMLVLLGHFVEHVYQLGQIHGAHTARPMALGLFGGWWPALVKTETMHYGFAAFMLAGLVWFWPKFAWHVDHGHHAPVFWWTAALIFQCWHFLEHNVLAFQLLTDRARESLGTMLFGIERAELHATYTLITLLLTAAAVHTEWVSGRWWQRRRWSATRNAELVR